MEYPTINRRHITYISKSEYTEDYINCYHQRLNSDNVNCHISVQVHLINDTDPVIIKVNCTMKDTKETGCIQDRMVLMQRKLELHLDKVLVGDW